MKDIFVLLLFVGTASTASGQSRPTPPLAPLAPLAPIAEEPRFSVEVDGRMELLNRLTLFEPGWRQGRSPEDSVYRAAREVLNRGEYRRAAELFAGFGQRYPASKYAAAASYWRAFALYRAGADADLRTSLGLLDNLTKESARATEAEEVRVLLTRVIAALAARGDGVAASRLGQGAAGGEAGCDSEDLSVRAEALAALYQNDPEGTIPVLRRILARRDECSIPLRRRAVYLLGKDGQASRVPEVVAIAQQDPSTQVRTDAISRLGQIPGDGAAAALGKLMDSNGDESSQRAVLRALRDRTDAPSARLLRASIEREDLGDAVRAEAIKNLACCSGFTVTRAPSPPLTGTVTASLAAAVVGRMTRATLADADVVLLRRVFDKSRSRIIRTTIVETMARSGGPAADAWLVGLVKDPVEDIRVRSTALGRLGRSDTPVGELIGLYDALTERDLRSSLVQLLGRREEPEATDKLIQILRTGTDPRIQRSVIALLSQKKDPRIDKLLAEIVEK